MRARGWVAVVLSTGLTLAGCGGGDGPAPTSTAAATRATPAAAPASSPADAGARAAVALYLTALRDGDARGLCAATQRDSQAELREDMELASGREGLTCVQAARVYVARERPDVGRLRPYRVQRRDDELVVTTRTAGAPVVFGPVFAVDRTSGDWQVVYD